MPHDNPWDDFEDHDNPTSPVNDPDMPRSREGGTRCPTTFTILSEHDLQRWFPRIVQALRHGFNITVRLRQDPLSESAGYLQEILISRLWQLIRKRRLQRFHLQRITFEILDE